ncbi:unnamed protein product [Pleuronectes platessa]|uniref:Uncharacterized protein n=1 Tax=Pleuronectes platessa TaxID=8262 RepID=A0A9N7Z7S0_PLEPL|nr:unnamed protein product [Pleuronectes platessa]
MPAQQAKQSFLDLPLTGYAFRRLLGDLEAISAEQLEPDYCVVYSWFWGGDDQKTRTRQMNELFNSRPCVWINDRVHLPTESSADVSATQSELISPVTAVRAAHGKIARHRHTAARPPGHERESTELLIRTLPAHPAGPPHPRTQSLICC